MNKKSLLLLVLSASLLSFTAQAKPDGAPAAAGKNKKGPPAPEQVIERLDTDGNGTLSESEVKGPLVRRFAQIDANGDGQIDLDEIVLAREERVKGAKEKVNKLKAADTDGNGSISSAEASAAGMLKMVENFAKIDTDGDGEISKQEMRTMRMKMERRSQQ